MTRDTEAVARETIDVLFISRSSAREALKKLTGEGVILRQGAGRSPFYVRIDGVER